MTHLKINLIRANWEENKLMETRAVRKPQKSNTLFLEKKQNLQVRYRHRLQVSQTLTWQNKRQEMNQR